MPHAAIDNKGSVQTYRREFMGDATWKESVGHVLHHRRWCLPCWSVQEAAICKANISDFLVVSCYQLHPDKARTWLGRVPSLGAHLRSVLVVFRVCFFLQRCRSFLTLLWTVGVWRALWENNDPGCLCQNKLPFLSHASDRSAPHDGTFWPPLQQTDEAPAPPVPGDVLSCPNLTIMPVYKLVKAGTSQIIDGLSQYVSRKCLNMHLWQWKTSRCLWSVMFVFIKFSPFHLKLPGRKPLKWQDTYLQKNPDHIQKEGCGSHCFNA